MVFGIGGAGGGDQFQTPPIRYIGYSFAFYEAMRNILRTKPERTYYAVGAIFILLHTLSVAIEKDGGSAMLIAFVDTMIFEGIASILVPVLVARAAVEISHNVLTELNIHYHVTTYGPAFVALLCILLMSRPLDVFTHKLMDKAIRQLY